MMPTTVDKLVEFFLHPIVTLIAEMPTCTNLVYKIYQISSNAESIKTVLRRGKLRLLALTVSPTVYSTLSSTSFIKPASPGPKTTIPTNINSIKQTAIQYKLIHNTDIYTLHQNMDKALKQQLLGSVEDIYVSSLKEKYVRYGNLTCLEVIDPLKANYYTITPSYLKLNTARMNVQHNINNPFESIIDKIDTAVEFADTINVLYIPE